MIVKQEGGQCGESAYRKIMNSKLMLKAAILVLLMPGTVTLFIPYLILDRCQITDWPHISAAAVLAIVAGLAAIVVLLHCIWEFAVHGKGTLAPVDPPKSLVVRGLYRYTRNPMYLSIMIVLLSEALLFESLSVLVYAVVVFLCFHLFVMFYEEPHLRSQFGESYEEYLAKVPRWRTTTRTFRSSKSPSQHRT